MQDVVQADACNIQVDEGIVAGPYERVKYHVHAETNTIQVDTEIDVIHVDADIDASQAESCVFDTSQVEGSQPQPKQKKH